MVTSSTRRFKSVLIANRGEIAVRIVREARRVGLKAIAVYSDADKGAAHVEEAVTAVHIGASPPRDSYLNIEKILAAAKATAAEAIHPGYGFLSENPDFAQAVIDAGLVWIGPSPSAIRAMGDKGAAKQIARKADVPVIPGYDGDDQSDVHLLNEAKKIGWPVLIKAANGGGGRGQRRVASEADFADALASARRESLSAFASDKVILERALDNVRHVEVQIFGDTHGTIVHLGERDCSIQRRNQKIIEEAPAPGVSDELRARMGDAAIRLARAVNYTNAGTVEFLLDSSGNFFFLEMNTRIQVEHPVTEQIVHANLIEMQFDVAMGKPVELHGSGFGFGKLFIHGRREEGASPPADWKPSGPQDQVALRRHAIEARVCAEDPADGFAPQVGHIEEIHWSGDVRGDSVESYGNPASGHYDSLLMKVIAQGETREEARTKLIEGLEKSQVVGIRSNRNFLIDLLKREAVAKGRVDIRWLEREPAYVENNLATPLAAIAGLWLSGAAEGNGWRSTGTSRTIVILRERANIKPFAIENGRLDGLQIAEVIRSKWNEAVRLRLDIDGVGVDAWIYCNGDRIHVHFRGRDALFEDITYAPAEPKDATGDGAVRAPMAGKIVRVNVEPGAKVEKGQLLVSLEAMKMEHEIVARTAGTVATVTAKPGDQVANRQVLVTVTT